MRTLITQTLLGSWMYQFNCAEGSEEEAQADFLRTLNREKSEPTEAMQKGIAFENGVYALARNPEDMTVFPDWREASRRIADIIRGGQIQVKVQRDIRVDAYDYLLYGICDVVKAGHIFDVKYTTKSMNSDDVAGKYLNSPQHPAYLYCLPEAIRFTYLVSDGKNLYTETYDRRRTPDIGEIIRMFRDDLRHRGLDGVYTEKWVAL